MSNQMLVLRSEDLFQAPEPVMEKLQKFLGLSRLKLAVVLQRANAGDTAIKTVDPELILNLRKILKTTAKGVRKRYGFGWNWA